MIAALWALGISILIVGIPCLFIYLRSRGKTGNSPVEVAMWFARQGYDVQKINREDGTVVWAVKHPDQEWCQEAKDAIIRNRSGKW